MRWPAQVAQSNERASTLKNAILLTKDSNASSAETFALRSRWVGLYLATEGERQTNPKGDTKGEYEVRWTICATIPSGR
jgi:hypothetical protein